MRHPIAFLAILAALACHPAAPSAMQEFPPESTVEPLVACVRSALADSPTVAEASVKRDHPRTVYARFVNPPDPTVGGMELVVVPIRGTPTQVAVEYTLWTGTLYKPGVPNLSKLNAPAVEATGAQLLRDVRDRCAPTAAGAPACSLSTLNEKITGRCSVGIRTT